MSSTTVTYSATTAEISLKELRHREEKARQALRRRLGRAQAEVAVQETRFEKLVGLLDEARRRLPDLELATPTLPGAPAGQDPDVLERHAVDLGQWVTTLERRIEADIAAAKIALDRRQKLGVAWASIHATVAELEAQQDCCKALANRVSWFFASKRSVEYFSSEVTHNLSKMATLEQVEAALLPMEKKLERLRNDKMDLERQLQSHETARHLAGGAIHATPAAEQLDAWSANKKAMAAEDTKRFVDKVLADVKLTFDNFPAALQRQITVALEASSTTDDRRQITDLITRHRARLNGIEKAETILANPPQYADDTTGGMATRWRNLVCALQQVTCGLEEWSASHEAEYRQVQEDCARAIQRAYAKANFIEVAVDAEFQVSGDADDLILMDLSAFPGYYIEVQTQPVDDGYATKAVLKADLTVSNARDEEVTEAVCAKLHAMAEQHDANISAGIEVLERKATVTRSKRPNITRKRALAIPNHPNSQ